MSFTHLRVNSPHFKQLSDFKPAGAHSWILAFIVSLPVGFFVNFLGPGAARGSEPPSAPLSASQQALGVDPHARWGYLKNGMGYLVIANHSAPLVGSSAIVHGGSGSEDWATQGASHFLEHMLFNGTERRTQEQIYDAMDLLGTYHNATTRATHVAFLLLAPTAAFWEALDVQGEMLFHSILPPDKLEKERGIILEELAAERDRGDYEMERLLDLDLFGPRGYGMPTLGSEVSIRNLSRDQILGFYHRFYRPEQVTWILVGDLDPDAAVDSLEARLGTERNGEGAGWGHPAGIDTTGPRVRIHYLDLPAPVLQWSWIGPNPSVQEFMVYQARTELLCAGTESPLGQGCLRRWSGQVSSYEAGLREYPGFSVATVRVTLEQDASVARLLDEFPAILEEARGAPLPEERLMAWRTKAEAEEEYLREKPHYYAIMRGDRIAARGLPAMAGTLSALREITPAQVGRLPAPLPWPPARTSVFLPSTPGSPTPHGSAPATPRESEFIEWELPNGAHAAALSSPESRVLAVHLFIRDRSAREPPGQEGMSELLHSLLGTRTASKTPEELKLRMDSIGAELKCADDPSIPYDDFYSVPEFSYARFQTLDPHAQEGLELLSEIVAWPQFTEEAFSAARLSLLDRAKRSEGSSRETVQRRLRAILHPERQSAGVYGSMESLSRIQRSDVESFALSYLDPRSFLIVLATGLPLVEFQGLVDETLGRIPSPRTEGPGSPSAIDSIGDASPEAATGLRSRLRSLGQDRAQADLWRQFAPDVPRPDSLALVVDSIGGAQSYLALTLLLQASPEDGIALTLANAILSDRIAFQLREREGLAYTIGSSLEPGEANQWIWTAAAGTAPAHLPRLFAGLRATPEELLAHPPDALEVRKTAARIHGRGLMRRATRLNWAYHAGLAILRGEDPRALDEREGALQDLSPDEVISVARRAWDKAPGLVVVAR